MTIHKNLAAGRWGELSLAEQLGNIGSDIHRAAREQHDDSEAYARAVARAFELLDLTIRDERWKSRLKELVRVREALGDAVMGGNLYASTFQNLGEYFNHFAVAARKKRHSP